MTDLSSLQAAREYITGTMPEEGGASCPIATDAASEGINLQIRWLMVSYDVS